MKLNKFQKAARKANLREVLAAGGLVASDGENMTAVFMPAACKNGNGHFSLSFAGNEKFKRKYGEFVALDRLQYGECLPISEEMFYDFVVNAGCNIRENDPPPSAPAKSRPTSGGLQPCAAWPSPT